MITSEEKVKERTKLVRKKMDKMFLQNSGITGMVFNENHPYFDVPDEYKELAENNFGLPIPEED
jgi:hypothetical protein